MGHDYVTLASGMQCGRHTGWVTVQDMAWQMGRLCRWTGAGVEFWSDMLHSFVVADFCPPHLKCYGLIHDSPECVGNDVPAPVKLDETRAMEEEIMHRTLVALGLPDLSPEDRAAVKRADTRALHGEAWVIGNSGNRLSYPVRDLEAEAVVRKYFAEFHYVETIERTGRGPKEFMKRYAEYSALLAPHNPNIPTACRNCGKPLLLENLYVDDGCPCNSPRGINFAPQPCDLCKLDCCVKPGHRVAILFGH